jgi:hypothetical protein
MRTLASLGSNNLTVPSVPTTGSPIELKTTREAIGLGFNKFFMNAWEVQVRFRNEEKDGARLFARGTTGTLAGFPGNFEFTPEPINSTTRQLDVILAARDRGLYHAITDCGAGGFSSAVGEMGAEIGAVVRLEAAPLKYAGLSKFPWPRLTV